MKKMLFALVLLSVSFGLAQTKQEYTARNGRSGTSFGSWTYVAQTDTTQAIKVAGWGAAYYVIGIADSGSITVSYMPSYDGVTFYPPVVIDSLSNANNGGNAKSIALPTGALGLHSVKFVRQVNTFRLGTSSPTAKEKIVLVN